MRIHIFISLGVFLLATCLKVSSTDWCLLIFAVFIVTSAEFFNTAVERLGDSVTKEQNKNVGAAKDIAAGAVLISSVGAAAIGFIVFVPYLAAL